MSSYHDGNHTPTIIAIQSDGTTIKNISADPSTHAIDISDGTTGSDNGPSNSRHDGSNVPILMATSSADGITPVAAYSDSSGNLLVKST